MKLPLLSKILKFSVYSKAIKSSGISMFSFLSASSLTFLGIFKDVLTEDFYKNLFVLVVLSFIAFVVYIAMWLYDFYTGTVAAKHEYYLEHNKKIGWNKSELLYNSFGKLGGVMLIKFMCFFICLSTLLVKFNFGFVTAIGITIFIDVLSFGFELKSIGENLERRTNKKNRFFQFWDKVFLLLEEGFLNKVKKEVGNGSKSDTE